MGRRVALWFVLLAGPATTGHAGERSNVRLRHETARLAVSRALDGAVLRLAQPNCSALLAEFRDANGGRLQDNLSALGLDAPAYVGTVFFYDGDRKGRCDNKDVIAVTYPGSRVVKVCHGFYKRWRLDPEYAEAILIHEALHTLGLGENPPSSREITGRVMDRCMGKEVRRAGGPIPTPPPAE